MLRRLFLYLIGAAEVVVSEQDVAGVTEALFASGLPVTIKKRRGGGRRIILRDADTDVFSDLCDQRGIGFEIKKRYGIPVMLKRYRRRAGLFLGAAFFFLALFISDDFVWRLDISGNETVSDEAIEAELESLGFGVGTYHKDIDFDVLHNRFLLASPDIAWIAINMKGSVARVEVREIMKGGGGEPTAPANIVAASDGIITQVATRAGSPQVKIGDAVRKGQLLVSGIVDYEGVKTDVVRAAGEVFAEVERVIRISVPLVSEENVKTGQSRSKYGIKIFKEVIFFGSGGRIDSGFYDTITEVDDVVLFDTVTLPIKVICERQEFYETVTRTLTPMEAAAEAYRQYKKAFIDACMGRTLLSYALDDGMNEAGDAYEIVCVLRVIEDIAETREFEVTE